MYATCISSCRQLAFCHTGCVILFCFLDTSRWQLVSFSQNYQSLIAIVYMVEMLKGIVSVTKETLFLAPLISLSVCKIVQKSYG